jgi:hypothetical protein
VTARPSPLLCELHAHTSWSDGALTMGEAVDLYGAAGFDVLCITDHVVRAGAPCRAVDAHRHPDYLAELDAEVVRARRDHGLLLLPGLELTYDDPEPLLAAHAVAVGLRVHVSVDAGIAAAVRRARESGAAIIAAHPYSPESATTAPRRTAAFAADPELAGAVDRFELVNRHEVFDWVARERLPAVATGDFHRREHLEGWKTLLPCAKTEAAVVGYLRSSLPAYLLRYAADEARAA